MDLGYSKRLAELTGPARATPDIIELSMCDPPRFGFKPDPVVLETIDIKGLEQGYPSVNQELVSGIRNRTKSFTGVSVDSSDLVITTGCGGAFGVLSIACAGKSVGIELDVTSSESAKKAFDKVFDEFGKLDIVVHNAGIAHNQVQRFRGNIVAA